MISSEVAAAIINRINSKFSGGTAEAHLVLGMIEEAVRECQYAPTPEPEANKIDFNHLHQWLEGVDTRLEGAIKFNSVEFVSIKKQFRENQENIERITYYLQQLERKMIELQGAQLGHRAARCEE